MQAAAYEANALPLDGINLDTEWHRNQKGYLDGNTENWYSGVFDWDRTLYNSPMEMMDWLETRCGGKRLLLRHFMLKLIILPRRQAPDNIRTAVEEEKSFFCRGLWPAWMDVHQSSGISPVNSLFPDFAKAMGLPPKYGDHNATDFVPPDVGDKTFVEAFFKLLDGQAGGRNYWWPDNGYGTALSNQHGTKNAFCEPVYV